jgi:hypothetical protein
MKGKSSKQTKEMETERKREGKGKEEGGVCTKGSNVVDAPETKLAAAREPAVRPEQTAVWFGLPLELQQMVWSYLQPRDLFLQNFVCHRWRTHCVEDQVPNFYYIILYYFKKKKLIGRNLIIHSYLFLFCFVLFCFI